VNTGTEKRWVLCPVCGAKTRIQVFRETEIKNFPLFCPKCRSESIIDIKGYIMKKISRTPRRSADLK